MHEFSEHEKYLKMVEFSKSLVKKYPKDPIKLPIVFEERDPNEYKEAMQELIDFLENCKKLYCEKGGDQNGR